MSENTLIPSVESLLDLPKSLADRAARVRDEALATGREAWLTGLGAVGVLRQHQGEHEPERARSLAGRGRRLELPEPRKVRHEGPPPRRYATAPRWMNCPMRSRSSWANRVKRMPIPAEPGRFTW